MRAETLALIERGREQARQRLLFPPSAAERDAKRATGQREDFFCQSNAAAAMLLEAGAARANAKAAVEAAATATTADAAAAAAALAEAEAALATAHACAERTWADWKLQPPDLPRLARGERHRVLLDRGVTLINIAADDAVATKDEDCVAGGEQAPEQARRTVGARLRAKLLVDLT